MVKKPDFDHYRDRVKTTLTTKEGFKNAIEVKSSDFAPSNHGFIWSNAHMDPTPPSERTWTWFSYFALWFSYSFTSGGWAAASALLSLNVNWWQAVLACFVGSVISGAVTSFNSRQSAVYHIGFPTVQRVSFGLYGSLFPVFTRAVVAILWIGVTVYQSSLFLDVALRCVFGDAWYKMPNTLPESASITTRKFVACFIVWIGSYPAMAFKIHKMRHIWTIKALIVPPCTIGMFIYCMIVGSKGATSTVTTSKTLHGSSLGWAFVFAAQSIIGSFSPMVASNPDIARYAKTPRSVGWSQFVTIVLWKTVICLIGILGTNALAYKYGETYWNLWDMSNAILTHNWSGGVRFAIFLFAIVMTISEQVKNLSANLISFGADSACLVPKYLNINRGMIFGLTVGFVIQPWHILATANSYLTFLTGYSLFLGAIPAIAITDYLLRKGNVDILSMYTSHKDYWYKKGWNWKAYVAYFMAIWPVCPGLTYQFDKTANIGEGWANLYKIGWLFAFVTGGSVYAVLSYLFKDPAMFEAKKYPWESYVDMQADLLDKEREINGEDVIRGTPINDSDSEQGKGLTDKGSLKHSGAVTEVQAI